MTVDTLYNILKNQVLILDGATGTELQKSGMPAGVCPEKWVSENPEVLIDIQKKYKASGSNVVYSCTFGGNRYKLEEFGLQDQVYELNKKLAEISREAMGSDGYVAGDIGPTGKFIEPFGDVAFEEAVEVFKEQAKGLLDGGIDFFVIETMIDIQEIRAAIIAIKEICDLPVLASMTYSEDGYTLTGTDPVSALITLQSVGADMVGCNCSTGPDAMLKIITTLKQYATVPLAAKPNAGLPKLVDGKTVFDMTPEEFAAFMPDFLKAGVNLFGGCCGTSFDYIRHASEKAVGVTPEMPRIKNISALSSARNHVFPTVHSPVKIVGERINPTGKKKLKAELKEKKFNEVKRFAIEQEQAGAAVLDVNMGMSGIDEKEMMVESIKLLSTMSNLPLCIDSSDPDVIEAALRIYPGRALVNSISYEKVKIEKLLPVAAKYGAMFVLLPLDDETIPATADGRKELVSKIYDEAVKYGFAKEDIVVDGLVMTVSSDQNAAKETLKLLNWCAHDFGVNTILGLSNVSFGLPSRKNVNAAFMAMAIANGLSMAIANPCEEILMNAKYAGDVLVGNDSGSKVYIEQFSKKAGSAAGTATKEKKATKNVEELVFDAIVEGDKDNIVDLLKRTLDETNLTHKNIVDDYLIKGINKVGDLYDKKIYFLPQLIASAEAMTTAFDYMEPFLMESNEEAEQKTKVILATVKGDIHDIGKNIVGLMLKNYGFDVIDLGKDVSAEAIVAGAKKENAKIIGLSALMTTTMTEMKTVVDEIKKQGLDYKVIIGGAVITQEYSDEIGAAGYARDGVEAVKLIKSLL